jgi:hypothetical protein
VLRHDFQPGRLVAGVALAAAAGLFAGDARGLWSVPWFAMVPLVCGGLCLAAAVGTVGYALRFRRRGTDRPPGPGATGAGATGAGAPGAGAAGVGRAGAGAAAGGAPRGPAGAHRAGGSSGGGASGGGSA